MNAIYLSQQALSQTNMIVEMLEVILDKKSSIHSKIISLNQLKKCQKESLTNIDIEQKGKVNYKERIERINENLMRIIDNLSYFSDPENDDNINKNFNFNIYFEYIKELERNQMF